MIELGIEIMPEMPVAEVVDTIRAAEEIGYSYCLLTDEGLMREVYAVLTAAALRTSRIMISPVTNGYTRHPALTAAGTATLNEISGGRAFVTLVAGGSMVLQPLGIERQSPLQVVKETIQILRSLWSGETITWQGEKYRLDRARLNAPAGQLPIWVAARGSGMLSLAGKEADGVVLMGKSDLPDALSIVEQSSAGRAGQPKRIYLDRIAFTPEMVKEAAALYVYSILDTPARMLNNLGITEEERKIIQSALETQGEAAAAQLITAEMIQKFQVAGEPEECKQILEDLISRHRLDIFLLDIVSGGLDANIRLMQDTYHLIQAAA
ncbi:MAG: LLM class flavin-dependent oxidoreductase [Anaerolineae bacterium]|nr:LLM class flavin-dependent oxidoreductase [Anaerolineae bacterium]